MTGPRGGDGGDVLVDTNLHVIAPPAERDRYPLAPLDGTASAFSEDQTTTVEDCLRLMDGAGVDQAFLIGSRFHGFDNGYCADTVARHPGRFVGVANVDVLAPDAPDRVRHWIGERGMHGVRFWGGGMGTATWIDDPRVRPAWDAVRDMGVPANAHTTRPEVLAPTRRFLDRYDDVALTLNHLGHVDPADGPDSAAARDLLALADYPRVVVNLPADAVTPDRLAVPAVSEFLHALVERFGGSRLIWSAFYPSRRDRSYAESVRLVRETAAALPVADRVGLLGGAAQALYPALGTVPAGAHPREVEDD